MNERERKKLEEVIGSMLIESSKYLEVFGWSAELIPGGFRYTRKEDGASFAFVLDEYGVALDGEHILYPTSSASKSAYLAVLRYHLLEKLRELVG